MRKTVVYCAMICALAGAARAQKVDINMATLAPRDSAWYTVMEKMGAEWRRISNGNVTLSIGAGGVLGDEPAAVRLLRSGSIQAAGLTSVGLSDIDKGVTALQIPMMFDDYEELDYVRDRMAPKLEKRIEDKGFHSLLEPFFFRLRSIRPSCSRVGFSIPAALAKSFR